MNEIIGWYDDANHITVEMNKAFIVAQCVPEQKLHTYTIIVDELVCNFNSSINMEIEIEKNNEWKRFHFIEIE